MTRRKLTALFAAAAITSVAAHAEPYSAKIGFSLDSERNKLEYRHGDLDVDAAHDLAMLHAAKFLTTQGKIEFKVESVQSFSLDWADRDAGQMTMDCGQFVCSERMGAEDVNNLNVDVKDGEIVVVVNLVSGYDAKGISAPEFNTGQIIHRTVGHGGERQMAELLTAP